MASQQGLGTAAVSPEVIEVGSSPLVRLTYTVGPRGIAAGGGIQLRMPRGCWAPVVMAELPVHRYLQVVNSDVELVARDSAATLQPRVWLQGVLESWIDIKVAGAPLSPGDQIIFSYGLRDRHSPPVRAQTYALPRVVFQVLVDVGGTGELQPLPESPCVELRAGPPVQLEAIAPSLVKVGEPFTLRLRAFDAYRNDPSRPLVSEVALTVEDGQSTPATLPHSVLLTAEARNRAAIDAAFTAPGVSTVLIAAQGRDGLLAATHTRPMSMGLESPEARPIGSVICDAGPIYGSRTRVSRIVDLAAFAARSNPVRCVDDEPGYRVFWGDIHCHSTLSDGVLPLDELYAWGRDVAALDIVAATDHESMFRSDRWTLAQQAANDFYKPGELVTFRAFEWTANNFGHRNVYYRTGEPTPALPTVDVRHVQYTMPQTELYQLIEDPGALIVPHHTLVAMDWERSDPRERLVEVYSTWGRSEFSGNALWDKPDDPRGGTQQGLARGYRLGLIAGSDGHDSRPGRCYPGGLARNLNFRGGLMAVLSPALTRDAIFDALWARRCYATTGERMLVQFSADGHGMGEEYHTDSAVQLHAGVTGTDRIALLEIIKNNEVLVVRRGTSETETLDHVDADLPGAGGCNYYYLRVAQEDGNMAWSSPIWVTYSPPRAGTPPAAAG